jgi:glucan biosynthesis protein C
MGSGQDAAPAAARSDARRFDHVDSLKVALTCGVIVAHSAITYGADGSWFYREPGVSDPLRVALDVPLALGSLFGMGLFFFLAGCFVPAALARKGPRRFLADRWLRLGAPLAVFVVVVVPTVEWAVARATGEGGSAGQVWGDQLRAFDAGPLWFAGVLLLFSTAYAAAAVLLRRSAGVHLDGFLLSGAAIAVAAVSFMLRLRFRIDSVQVGSAHVWQWGQCLVLFALGIAAGPAVLAEGVSDRVRRLCGAVVGAGGVVLVVLLFAFQDDLDPLGGGWSLPAAVVAMMEGGTSVAAAVLLAEHFRRHHPGPPRRPWVARAAYAAYVLQTPVLVAAALLLRPVPVPAGAKLALLAPLGVAACFVLAAALVRIPPLRRVL